MTIYDLQLPEVPEKHEPPTATNPWAYLLIQPRHVQNVHSDTAPDHRSGMEGYPSQTQAEKLSLFVNPSSRSFCKGVPLNLVMQQGNQTDF